jgi:N-formylglutamate deformylase
MMDDFITIQLDGDTPLVATAIHNGHSVSENIRDLFAVSESVRLREEDPYTEVWTKIASNRIIGNHSRFEFDINRPPEKAIYITPEDSWGIKVWKTTPDQEVLTILQNRYNEVYQRINDGLTKLLKKLDALLIFDLHSYNHHRPYPDSLPEDTVLNPDINIGTGTMDRVYWSRLIDRFIDELGGINLNGRQLDVRENIKFKGGYFPKWLHENFNKSVCCISVEVKKIYMNEWTGEPDYEMIESIGEALKHTIPGVLEELANLRNNPRTE